MASSSTSVKRYDVFISFRGTDTRKGFTSFLYDALCEKGIKVFIGEEDLNKGDEISPVLLEAIKASAISIIVFSENYAQSRWCLDELNHIVRCMKKDQQRVLPVFYKVKPTNIRKQTGSFKVAFSEHEIRFGRNSEKLKMWRESLATAANLSGFDSIDARFESEMIKQIVEYVMEILKMIPSTSSYDTNGLVGIESVFQKIEPSLCPDSTNKDTRVIDIWGKTTFMASSSTSVKRYDVFISFRGDDTRWGFTKSLHDALCDKGIKAFIDEEDLNKGDEISPVLVEAIKASAISIIVFSKNYAQSRWCLDELNHIVCCMKEDKQCVLPVFYKVKPTNIRNQTGSFEVAFSKLETRCGRDSEKLKMWRESLRTTANLTGFNSAGARSESELIKEIVRSVMEKLKMLPSTFSDDTNGLVGIESILQKIESSLCIDSTNKDTRVIGIWGMGGIGKTTIARVLFNKFYNRFSGFYFLENVREEVMKHQSSDLQKRVFSELLKEKDLKHVTSREKDRLRHKNVLFVLDDVNDVEQLDLLGIDRECFGPGSRIVVTSRDSHVLSVIKADEIHEMEDLSFGDACRLFLSKAFDKEGNESPAKGYLELAETIVKRYGKGNPLALTVLGRYLYSRSIEEWKSEMELLDSTPNHEVQDILKVSYGGLSQNHKDMFLDIACFLKGSYETQKNTRLQISRSCYGNQSSN